MKAAIDQTYFEKNLKEILKLEENGRHPFEKVPAAQMSSETLFTVEEELKWVGLFGPVHHPSCGGQRRTGGNW